MIAVNVNLLETQSVHRHRHVSRLIRTRVQIPIVQRQQIQIVEYETVPGGQLHSLHETHIQQGGPIELAAGRLFDHEQAVVDLLLLQQGMQVGQEHGQMVGALAVRDHNGDAVAGHALGGSMPAAGQQRGGEPLLEHRQRIGGRVDRDWAV